MIQDFFSGVTAAEAAGFVGVLSLANMSGRFIWSSTSDVIGRKPMYMTYLGVGAVLYFVLATWGTVGLGLFLAVTIVILSFYGGGFATIPAYLKDLFGGHQVGAIHGRLLDGVVVRRGGRPVDRELDRRLRGGGGQARRRPVRAVAVHHGRGVGGGLHRQLAGPPGKRALPHALGLRGAIEAHRQTATRHVLNEREGRCIVSSSDPTEAPQTASSLPGYGLWVLVTGALLYGVVKTIDTSAALFTGG